MKMANEFGLEREAAYISGIIGTGNLEMPAC